jgi:hypothetical protein
MKRLQLILCAATALLALPMLAPAQTDASTWTDPQTGLTWTRQDNGSKVTWNEATAYCRNLHLAGRSDWRLPEVEELRTLFDSSSSTRVENLVVHVNRNIQISSMFQWSNTSAPPAEDGSPSVWMFDFFRAGSPSRHQPAGLTGALCVSGKPPQVQQGATLEQTVTWLNAKLKADAVDKILITPNGIMEVPQGTDGGYNVVFTSVRTISQEECKQYNKDKDTTTTYPCIHLTGGPWYRVIWPNKGTDDPSIKQMYFRFEPGTEMGPILKAFKRLAVIWQASIVDDDLFK